MNALNMVDCLHNCCNDETWCQKLLKDDNIQAILLGVNSKD